MSFVSQRLAENIDHLADALKAIPEVEVLTPHEPTKRAGIITFRHPEIARKEVYPTLMQAGVICAARAGGIRLAPHFYTPEAVLNTAISKFRQIIQ